MRKVVMKFPFPEHDGAGVAAEFISLRGQGPVPVVLPSGVSATLVHRYDEVRAVLTDTRLSRSAAARYGMTVRSAESLALNSADPPDHSRRRRVVATAFTHRRADAMRAGIEELAEDLVTGMLRRGGVVDLIDAFTRPLAVTVICRLFGLPPQDYVRFGPPVEVMMSTSGFTRAQIDAAHREMFEYLAQSCNRRQAEPAYPADDLLSTLVRQSAPGGPLSRTEAIHLGYGLLMAGYETTTHQLAACVHLLLADRSRWERLHAAPHLVAPAVEELLRWTSLLATGGAPHATTVPLTLGTTLVPAGRIVVPALGAANRDPAAFDDPDEIRLDRVSNPHIAFGYGRHLCPGAPLARVELTTALAVLLRRLPTLRPACDVPRWRRGAFVRGLTALPVRW